MKIHGWCERCHRVKRVHVTRPLPGAAQVGVCDDCEEKERRRR